MEYWNIGMMRRKKVKNVHFFEKLPVFKESSIDRERILYYLKCCGIIEIQIMPQMTAIIEDK
jgi:hypothetical protein